MDVFIGLCVCALLVNMSTAILTEIIRVDEMVFFVSDIHDTSTYKESQGMCNSLNGGRLATFVSKRHYEIVRGLISEEIGSTFIVGCLRTEVKILEGMNESANSTNHANQSIKYEYYWQRIPDHPEAAGHLYWAENHKPTSNCVYINHKGYFLSTECNVKRRFICFFHANMCPRLPTWRNNPLIQPQNSHIVPMVYVSELMLDFDTAERFCRTTGGAVFVKSSWQFITGELVAIVSKSENDFLARRIEVARTKQDYDSDGTYEGYIIGVHRDSGSNSFSYRDLYYANQMGPIVIGDNKKGKAFDIPWDRNQPDGKDTDIKHVSAKCVTMGENLDATLWNDMDCSRRARFMCKYICTQPIVFQIKPSKH